MGKPKHGADSARAKSCKAYKNAGKYEINKTRKAEKIAAGKKIKSRKQPKTWLMKWDNLIRNVNKSIPYCDANYGVVWGVNKDAGISGVRDVLSKEKKKEKRQNKKGKNKSGYVSASA